MFDSVVNLKLASASNILSFEQILARIEEGISMYRQSGNPSKLLAASLIFHIKVDAQKTSNGDILKTFDDLERISTHIRTHDTLNGKV